MKYRVPFWNTLENEKLQNRKVVKEISAQNNKNNTHHQIDQTERKTK